MEPQTWSLEEQYPIGLAILGLYLKFLGLYATKSSNQLARKSTYDFPLPTSPDHALMKLASSCQAPTGVATGTWTQLAMEITICLIGKIIMHQQQIL